MLLEEIRRQVIETAIRMSNDGLVRSTWGNVSCRDVKTGYLAVTPSGMTYHLLQPEDIVIMDVEGKIIDGLRRPSIESPMHRIIMDRRPDVQAVVHTHSVYATAYSTLGQDLPVISTELAALAGGTVRTAPYATSGTDEFGHRTIEALGTGGSAALLQNHGVVAVGASLDQAYDVALGVEESAKMYFIASTIGTPIMVPEEERRKLYHFLRHGYGQPLDRK
ncbi:MAG: class II aldolase/adducin family protein [Actinobacteria bacterium]|nr:class II aldolase/adducin family protein [Actinomycetota bacterium]